MQLLTEEIGTAPNGHTVWKETHVETGHVRYFSSEVDGTGATVWDTFSDPSTVMWVLEREARYLQGNVWDWAKETFGHSPDIGIAVRGNKEMAELLSTLINKPGQSADIIEECADVAFFLFQVCELHGGSLMRAVAEKLEINKKRSWEKASDGSFQHVRE